MFVQDRRTKADQQDAAHYLDSLAGKCPQDSAEHDSSGAHQKRRQPNGRGHRDDADVEERRTNTHLQASMPVAKPETKAPPAGK